MEKLSRKQLYELIWSTPASKLAQQFGVSDVAIAKRCRKLNVPRPPRGYWAKIAVGETPPKPPLPPDPTSEVVEKQVLAADATSISCTLTHGAFHPAVAEMLTALRAGTPDSYGRVRAESRAFPRITVSPDLFDRAARALDTIICVTQQQGIPFRAARSKYKAPYFEHDQSQLYLTIEELIVTLRRGPTDQELRHPTYEWNLKSEELAHRLTFFIYTEDYSGQHYVKSNCGWSEEEGVPIQETIRKVVDGILKHYAGIARQKAESMERWRRAEEERKMKEQAEREKAHGTTLRQIANKRADDLFYAAEWFRLYLVSMEFIDACEQTWKKNQSDSLTEEQQRWLAWAERQARTRLPFDVGYPDPAIDGPFDPATVPAGGPYPGYRNFPIPPTIPPIPAPVAQQRYGSEREEIPAPYPFWLKHQGR